MVQKTLGKRDRNGRSLLELASMSLDAELTRRWLEGIVWMDGYIDQKS